MVIQDRADSGLKALADEYARRFAPESPEERLLVETLAISEWRNRLAFTATLKQLIAAQTKRSAKTASSGLFVVPKRPRA